MSSIQSSRSRTLALTAALTFVGSSYAATSQVELETTEVWRPVGLGGGGHASRVAWDPNDETRILIGTDVAGLFQSTDDGESWSTSTRGLSDFYIRDVAAHPDDPELLLVATGQGVSRSTDGGKTWTTVLERTVDANPAKYAMAFAAVEWDPVDPLVAWAGAGGFRFSGAASPGGDDGYEHPHLWQSTDSGVHWMPLPALDPDHLGAGHGGSLGLFLTTSGSPNYGYSSGWNAAGPKHVDLGPGGAADVQAALGSDPPTFTVGLRLQNESLEESVELAAIEQVASHVLEVVYEAYPGGPVMGQSILCQTVQEVVSILDSATAYTSDQQQVHVRYAVVAGRKIKERAFLEFGLSSLPSTAEVLSVNLVANVLTPAQSSATQVGVWRLGLPLASYFEIPSVHSIVPYPVDFNTSHPGAELVFVSTTVGVFLGYTDGTTWTWIERNAGLPHTDCRDLEATFNADDSIARLYLALDSEWDLFHPTTVNDNAQGYGGGVWCSDDLGFSWQQCSDGFELEYGARVWDSDLGGWVPTFPKNMRHLAIDRGAVPEVVYAALTWRSMFNEGVWSSSPGAWDWRRETQSACFLSDPPPNVVHDYHRTLGQSDGLEVGPQGDVVFTCNNGAYRRRAGEDRWYPLHTRFPVADPEPCMDDVYTYATNGFSITGVLDLTVDPEDPSVWFLAAIDQGLERSDDGGETWRRIGDFSQGPYAAYGVRNCRGVYPNPDPDKSEWFGVYGYWKPAFSMFLWLAPDRPDDSTPWTPVALTPAPSRVFDVLFVDGEHVLVATNQGIFDGTRAPDGVWTFVHDPSSSTPGSSREAVDLAVDAATGEVLAAFRTKGSSLSGWIAYREGGAWQPATPPAGIDFNPFSLTWSAAHAGTAYAGNSSGGLGSGNESAGVMFSTDLGRTWQMTSQVFDPSEVPGDEYDLTKLDVEGLATLLIPDGNGGRVERVYAALDAREGVNRADWQSELWGGVFYLDDPVTAGPLEAWRPRSAGLGAGKSNFIKADPGFPLGLFYACYGNGAFVLREYLEQSFPSVFVEEAQRHTGSLADGYACSQNTVRVSFAEVLEDRLTRRAFMDFPTASIPDEAVIQTVWLTVAVEDGAASPATTVELRQMSGSVASYPGSQGCAGLFQSIHGAPVYATADRWDSSGYHPAVDLGPDAAARLQAALNGNDPFSVGLQLADESPTGQDAIELHPVGGALESFLSVLYLDGEVTWGQSILAGVAKESELAEGEAGGGQSISHDCSQQLVRVRYHASGNDTFTNRAFFEFDLGSLPDPGTIQIDLAEIDFALYSGATPGMSSVEVKEMTQAPSSFGGFFGCNNLFGSIASTAVYASDPFAGGYGTTRTVGLGPVVEPLQSHLAASWFGAGLKLQLEEPVGSGYAEFFNGGQTRLRVLFRPLH